MMKFIYKAKKGPSETIDGVLEAENLDQAVEKIVKLGLVPIDVILERRKEERAPRKEKSPSFSFHPRVKISEIALFTRQLADLIEAGVPILQSLNVIHAQTQNPIFKENVDKIRSLIKDGSTLSEALKQYPQNFSQLYVSMVKSGEVSGNLGLVLNRLAAFADQDEEIRSKVRSSLIYPSLILLVGLSTIFVLLTFVIPRLTVMFDDLAQELPLPTVILLSLSSFLEKFWWLLLILLGLGVFYFKKYINSLEGRLWFDRLKLKIPLLRDFIKDVEIGRFARTLGTLLDNGVIIVSALESVWGVMGNEVIKQQIKKASEEVAGGISLSMALRKSQDFPEPAMNMIAVGEESGHLEQALYKLADSYERRSDRAVKAVVSLLEPLLIVFIGSAVGFIVIAMLLPIFRMNLIIK